MTTHELIDFLRHLEDKGVQFSKDEEVVISCYETLLLPLEKSGGVHIDLNNDDEVTAQQHWGEPAISLQELLDRGGAFESSVKERSEVDGY